MKKKELNKKISLFQTKDECCGCGACFSICPKGAITMKQDEEGFLYPVINEKKCVYCKKCISVCRFKRKLKDIKGVNNEEE